jgi:hypothetical protein
MLHGDLSALPAARDTPTSAQIRMLVSTIEPVEVVLAHQLDQLGRVVRRGSVACLVDLTGKRVRIAFEL